MEKKSRKPKSIGRNRNRFRSWRHNDPPPKESSTLPPPPPLPSQPPPPPPQPSGTEKLHLVEESACMNCMGILLAGPLAWRALAQRCCTHLCNAPFLLIDSFRPLASCPREYWVILALKLLESFAYFSMALNFVLFMSEEFGLSDFNAGLVYGVWGILTSVFGIATSFLMDRIGIRYAIVVGGCISLAGRLGMSMAPSAAFAIFAACGPLAIGQSLAIPVMTVAVRRYSTEKTSALAFGLYYTVQNIGALLSGPFTDILHGLFTSSVPDPNDRSVQLTSMRLIFFTGALMSAIYAVLAFFCLRDIEMVAGVAGAPDELRPYVPPAKQQNLASIARMLATDRVFHRLLVLSSLLSFVNLLFRFLDAMFPKYLLRTIGADARYGTVYAINPLMIILLVPLLSALTSRADPYQCITVGAAITATSVIFLCAGHTYATAILFILQLSVGEALYSPRAYQYAMLLSARGFEGVYSTFASLPMFGSKLLSGVLSGWLLESFCSEEDGLVDPRERNCVDMWIIVLMIVTVSPVFLVFLRRWIVSEEVRQRIKENGGSFYLDPAASSSSSSSPPPPQHGSIPLQPLASDDGDAMEQGTEWVHSDDDDDDKRSTDEQQRNQKGMFVIEDIEASGRAGNL